jgi:phosphate transport system ATP-binding protein
MTLRDAPAGQPAPGPEVGPEVGEDPRMELREVSVFFDDFRAVNDASLQVRPREVLALMGPSGCGKSTLLRCLNRMNDPIPRARVTGEILLDGDDIYAPGVDPAKIRARVGMVSQAPNPFPKSVFENIAFGPRVHGFYRDRAELQRTVEDSLKRTGLWEEVCDKMEMPGTALSGGQQQRLCVARAIANRPDVVLMDEPTSALDPKSSSVIEDLIRTLAEDFSIVVVTHNMEQAQRIADRTAFLYLGEVVEAGETEAIFENPRHDRTKEFLGGRFG